MKNKKTNKFNKLIISLVLVIGLLTSSFSGFVINLLNSNHKAVYAESVESIDKSSAFISNYNFSTTSSTTTPPKATGWTAINDNVSNPENLVSGVFNSYDATVKSDENYLDNYKILETPGHATNQTNLASSNAIYKSLMINSSTEYGRQGFKSGNFTLEADSYYMFEVILKTITADNKNNSKNTGKNYADFDSRASIYLVDSNNEILTSFEMVDSQDNTSQVVNGYARYKIYLSTTTFSSLSANLQLYLGSKDESTIGPVFFNNVKVLQLSQNRYLEETQTIDSNNTRVLNLNSGVLTNTVENASFDQDWQNGWTLVSKGNNGTSKVETINGNNADQSQIFISAELTANDVPYTNNTSNENNYVLMMHNSQENYVGIESSEIEIKQHGFYKLSVWAWCNSSNSTAPTIKLIDKSDRELEDVIINVNTKVSSSTSLTNGWTKYSFYISGDPYQDVKVALQLWLGTEDKNASGYVYFDDVTLQTLSYSEYSSYKNSNTLVYNVDNSTAIKNYSFDLTDNQTNEVVYPLLPNSWTANTQKEYAKSGIVNINSEKFNAQQLKIGENSAPTKPEDLPIFEADASNNVLMIASSQNNISQSYTSASTSLSEGYYTLTLWYHSVNGGVGIKLFNESNYLYKLDNLSSNGWQKVEFLIKKDSTAVNLQVELSLSGVAGYAYFDEVELLTSTEAYFNDTNASEYVVKIDITNQNFENTYDDNSAILPLNGFSTLITNNQVECGIVNLSKGYAGINNSLPNSKYALAISSESDVYYFVENNIDYTLAENSYYQVNVDVFTYDLRSEGNEFGARLFLSGEGLDKELKNITTQGWQTCSFIIKATTATTATLQLGLGDSENACSGIVLFDNITFTALTDIADDKAFEALVQEKEDDKYTSIISSTTSEEDSDEEDSNSDNYNSNIWYIIPSLISALALVFAIVVTFARKIKWRKPSKKIKSSYDRKQTLEKDLDRRERINLRKENINKLQHKVEKLDAEIEKLNNSNAEKDKAIKDKLQKEYDEALERKNKTTSEKEQLLNERNAKIAVDKNAISVKEEEELNAYIKKLTLKESKEQKIVSQKASALKQFKQTKDVRIEKAVQQKTILKKEIAQLEKEIEAIAKEEAKALAENNNKKSK